MELTLKAARSIAETALAKGHKLGLNPLTIAVLDAGGHMKVLLREDKASPMRPKVASGKAGGAIAMGMGSRALFNRAQEQPFFIQSMNGLADGMLVPVPGGVLIRDKDGNIAGAVGITGDTSDRDEECAIAGIEDAGFTADPG